MRIQIGFAGGLAMGWLLLGLTGPALAADGTVDVCLKSGILIRATKVEIKGGNLAIETEKGASVKIPNDTVASIGVPCPAAATSPAPAATAPATTSAAITQAVAAVPMPAATGRFGIAGSNTIGERLMPMLIDAFAKAKLGKPAKFTPAGQEQQQVQLFQGTASAPVVTIDLKAQGSATAYPALLDATALIGMSSRPAKAEEAASVSQKFNVDLLAAGSAHVLGLDGLAVIVNPANPIRSLDLTTIARIFSGQITDWSVVGGFDANGNPVTGPKLPIALHARDDKSGTFDTFKNLVLGKLDPAQPLSPKASRYESSESLSAAVTKDAGAIGFIGLPYINQNHALGISSDCGLVSEPSRFAVKTEEYALTRRLFLYTIGAPREPMAQHLIDFALSDEAQKTVSDAEFIDQSVEFADPAEQKQWADGLI